MTLQFLGATGTVSGSKYLLQQGGKNILVDCGLFQGRIHCTAATRDLCGILLPDSARLQEEEAEYANRRGFSRCKPALPLYTEKDALHCHEIIARLRGFDAPPRRAFITHGEPGPSDALRQRIEQDLHWQCEVPDYLEERNAGLNLKSGHRHLIQVKVCRRHCPSMSPGSAQRIDRDWRHPMQTNVGNTDRVIRIVGGLLIMVVLYLFLPGDARWLGLLGLIPVATGFVRWCPLYAPFGISTCKPRGK